MATSSVRGRTATSHAAGEPAREFAGGYTDIFEFADPDCGGASNNYTALPSVFEYFRKQKQKAPEDCVYVLKNVGCPWRGSMHPDYGSAWWPLYDMAGYTDASVWTETQSVLVNESPELLLVYLADVDHYGHAVDAQASVTVTSGATEALFCAVHAVVRPGDEVAFFPPVTGG